MAEQKNKKSAVAGIIAAGIVAVLYSLIFPLYRLYRGGNRNLADDGNRGPDGRFDGLEFDGMHLFGRYAGDVLNHHYHQGFRGYEAQKRTLCRFDDGRSYHSGYCGGGYDGAAFNGFGQPTGSWEGNAVQHH